MKPLRLMSAGIAVVYFMLLSSIAYAQDTLPGKGPAESPLKSLKDKASYGLGLNIAANLEQSGYEVTPELLVRGLLDALEGRTPLLTPAQLRTAITNYDAEMRVKQTEKAKLVGEKNKADGAAFLAANKKKTGVITLPSGLQYKVVRKANGPSPKATDTVSTNYRGTLINGEVFDSSYDRGQPASFPVNRVIAGWIEALQLMKVGEKWQLFIPSELAYGATPRQGGPIGPHATLLFDIELLSIEK